jgi:hypothetical protein
MAAGDGTGATSSSSAAASDADGMDTAVSSGFRGQRPGWNAPEGKSGAGVGAGEGVVDGEFGDLVMVPIKVWCSYFLGDVFRMKELSESLEKYQLGGVKGVQRLLPMIMKYFEGLHGEQVLSCLLLKPLGVSPLQRCVLCRFLLTVMLYDVDCIYFLVVTVY